MAVNITKRPTTTTVGLETFLHLTANEVPLNDGSGDEVRHYMTIEAAGHDTLRSQDFAGDWTWDGVILPTEETWTAYLREVVGDASIANLVVIT